MTEATAIKVDFERAALLFGIMKSVADIGPSFTAISGEAGRELRAMNDELLKEQKKRADAEKYEAEAKAAAEYARQKAEAEAPERPERPQPQRIFPEGSGVREDHDPPRVERR